MRRTNAWVFATAVALLMLYCSVFAASQSTPTANAKPKIRAVTAFVRLDRTNYQSQLRETLTVLRGAKAEFEHAGYEVQSVRITTQPFPEIVHGLSPADALKFFQDYDKFAHAENFDASIGPAMVSDGDDPKVADLLAQILSSTTGLEGSIIVAGEDGMHWNAIRAAARVMKSLEQHSPHSLGNFNFAATAMLPPHAPFYPGSYHDDAGHEFAIGMQSASVVAAAFASAPGDPNAAARSLASMLTQHAQTVERIAHAIENKTGWRYLGLDLSPAPLKDDSIGTAIENFTKARFGSSGTMTAVSVITGVLKQIPVQRAGYSGLMLPILEDSTLAQRWSEGTLTIDGMLAYSAVCGTGLDTIPLPGDVTEEQLAKMIGDMASLAFKWHKPLSARLLPVQGKKPGDRTEFDDPFLVNAVLQRLP
jgi:uncharacterized protein (UPF0210 family)